MVRVFASLSLVAAVTPSGDPTLKPGLDPASVTPGTLGFLATLFIVVMVIFLIRDMVKRVRRVRYAAEVEQARDLRNRGGTGESPVSSDGRAEDRTALRIDSDADTATDIETGTPTNGGRLDVPRPGGSHGPDNR